MTDEKNCPNMKVCKLVTVSGFSGDEERRLNYMKTYCTAGEASWSGCNRLTVKNAIHFCPDFVLPDSGMTADEVISRFDEETMKD